MPTYEYRCAAGHLFEQFQRMSEAPLQECPQCGAGVERLLSAGVGLLFKGSGFYITDYRSDSYRQAAAAEAGTTAGSAGGEAGSGGGKDAGSGGGSKDAGSGNSKDTGRGGSKDAGSGGSKDAGSGGSKDAGTGTSPGTQSGSRAE